MYTLILIKLSYYALCFMNKISPTHTFFPNFIFFSVSTGTSSSTRYHFFVLFNQRFGKCLQINLLSGRKWTLKYENCDFTNSLNFTSIWHWFRKEIFVFFSFFPLFEKTFISGAIFILDFSQKFNVFSAYSKSFKKEKFANKVKHINKSINYEIAV